MLITLPDESVVSLDVASLRFSVVGKQGVVKEAQSKAKAPFGVDAKELSRCMSSPSWRFSDCFRRVSDHPRYSPKSSVHSFDVTFLARIYEFPGQYLVTFSQSHTEWHFLDGGIIKHSVPGWGGHRSTVVEGAEALRAVCLFFGITQPRRIKGESSPRPLAKLLAEMTVVPLQKSRDLGWRYPTMNISREQALEVFHKRYPRGTVNVFSVTQTVPDRCAVYMPPPRNCWFILFLEEPFPMRLQSSRIVVISKDTGEIVEDGVANDEG